jgi:hypothetical protein
MSLLTWVQEIVAEVGAGTVRLEPGHAIEILLEPSTAVVFEAGRDGSLHLHAPLGAAPDLETEEDAGMELEALLARNHASGDLPPFFIALDPDQNDLLLGCHIGPGDLPSAEALARIVEAFVARADDLRRQRSAVGETAGTEPVPEDPVYLYSHFLRA